VGERQLGGMQFCGGRTRPCTRGKTLDHPLFLITHPYMAYCMGAWRTRGSQPVPPAGCRAPLAETQNLPVPGTATESTAWASDNSVACMTAAGARGLVRVAITVTSRPPKDLLPPTSFPPVKASLARPANRKVDTRLTEEGNSNSYGARPVHQII
jgi:hypothetical protein